MMFSEEVLAKFWARVEKTESCWIWTGAKIGIGRYGAFYLWGRMNLAHRISWEIHYGPIAWNGAPEAPGFADDWRWDADGIPIDGKTHPGDHICHHCDNPPCVRPDHLFRGTNTDNILDKTMKGRAGKKLDAEKVRAIRNSTLRQHVLAKVYGVSEDHIGAIVRRIYWKHI